MKMLNNFQMNLLKIQSIMILFFIAQPSFAGFDIKPGEELTYEVSYMGAKLGTIIISTGKLKKENGISFYDTKAEIKTYKSIPFLNINVEYNSKTDKSVSFAHQFIGNYKSNDYWDIHKIFLNYAKSNIYVSKENEYGKYFEKSYQTTKKYSDGLTIFFIARNFLTSGKKITFPTIVDKQLESTEINFIGKNVDLPIKAVKYPVKTLYFNGKANWTGIYGLSGGFEGWFSNDDARVPIVAKLNLYIGAAKVELIKWKRSGWEPPK